MPKFLVIKDDKAIDSIIADTEEIATQLTGCVCVEVKHEVGEPDIGWSYVKGKFIAPKVDEPETKPLTK